MPIYDYACGRCGRVVEVVHAVDGQGPAACEVCGGAMKKLLSPPAVHFKGSGFHNTDYRPRPKSEESSPSGKDSCASAGGSAACASCPASD